MKKSIFLIYLIPVFCLHSCNNGSDKNDSAGYDPKVADELQMLWADYIKVSNKGDADQLVSFFTADYVNMPHFGSTQNGREETIGFLKDFAEKENPSIFNYERTELFVHNTMAYEFGILEMSKIPSCGDQVIFKQRCLTVFKKDSDGKWRFHRWMGQPE